MVPSRPAYRQAGAGRRAPMMKSSRILGKVGTDVLYYHKIAKCSILELVLFFQPAINLKEKGTK